MKLWKIFIPQNVRESQEFLPQVHEIPKEYRQRLKETGELEEDFSSEQLEGLRRRYFEQQIRSVLDLVEDKNYKYLVILGDPGSGKSTLLQYIALKWAELLPKYLPLYPIPLLIELRTYVRNYDANKCNDFLDFLAKGRGVVCRLPKPELHEKLEMGDAIVMFDGLDEVFDPAKREEVITDIHRFTNDYKNVRVIVTSRVIGYKTQKLRDAEFYHFMLQDLEAEQVEEFIQRWHKLTYQDEAEKVRKRERLKQAIKDSRAIEELAGNPLLLTMMAILNRHQELPRDRAELYNQASRVLLQQWDMERALVDAKIDPITIDYKDKQAILRRVAFFMQENEAGLAGNLIAEKDLREIISEYLKSIDINDARPMAKALIEQLRTRNFILCFVGAEYYAFVHRTFLEYFCAWSFVWQFKETQSLEIDGLINDVFGKHWRDEKWHEVLRLIVGMIDTKFVGDIISYLLEQEGEEEKFHNLFLAGKCLFEVRSRQSIDDVEERLLNRLKGLTEYDLGYYYEPYDGISFNDSYSQEIYEKNVALVYEIRTQAVEVVATTWRDDPETYTWLKQRVVSDDNSDVRREAVRQIATGWKHEPGILDLLKQWVVSDDDSDVRQEAVRQIATGWKHEPGILDLLKQRVVSDDNWKVRQEAVRQIATGWKNEPGILELLKQWVVSDDHWAVRSAAVEQIAAGWKNEPGILELLKQWVVSDDHWAVRSAAVEQIAAGWKNEPGILELLKQWVVSDDNWDVRQEAVRQIATVWKHEPGILELLKQRVVSDDNWKVRQEAVRQIATGWKHEPGILDLLKQWVVSDDDSDVRQEAVRQIAT
ncbi:HEAT repeat domain-containing protein, partial [Okeania sp. SIO3B5]|uniref:NACHT domain-containing protein n=1 Tax=Okeania sp. SIO3B5 TaxID=2607811 RepID=UPI003454CE49